MQSSQRSTMEATSPSISLVRASSLPGSYVSVSTPKNLLTARLSVLRMRSFIFLRNDWNSSTRLPMGQLYSGRNVKRQGKKSDLELRMAALSHAYQVELKGIEPSTS